MWLQILSQMKRCHKIISRNQRKAELVKRNEESADLQSVILCLHYKEITTSFQSNI